MNYKEFFEEKINNLKCEQNYRYFTNIRRKLNSYPYAEYYKNNVHVEDVVVWCSNDYLNMSQHPIVIDAMIKAIHITGAGSGGTRNISGNTYYHTKLENELAKLHNKEGSLIFSSGYTANQGALITLGSILPGCVIFSDADNHASIIHGIKSSNAEKYVFRHNDIEHLESLLMKQAITKPKIIVFESVYSMSGSVAPIEKFIELAQKYNALTYVDEVHAVGMYGYQGGGIAQMLGVEKQIDIIQGTLGKAFGVMGGYIASSAIIIDFLRSFASSFIFTTSLPPAVIAAANASVKYLRSSLLEREKQKERVNYMKDSLRKSNISFLDTQTHIIPIIIGDSKKCRVISEMLLNRHKIYVQPINYPTVPKGTERLRISPTPAHSIEMIDEFVQALKEVY